jgi:hypothetical protein
MVPEKHCTNTSINYCTITTVEAAKCNDFGPDQK